MQISREKIAQELTQKCYWKNTKLSPKIILKNIKNKNFARMIFSAIFHNSTHLMRDLSLIDEGLVIEFIREQKIGSFRQKELQKRLDCLINLYIDPSHKIKKC